MKKVILLVIIIFIISNNVYSDKIKDIYDKYYKHGRFKEALRELTSNYLNFDNTQRAQSLYLEGKCYYFSDNLDNAFIIFNDINNKFPDSKIVTSGQLSKTIINIMKREAKKDGFNFTYALASYELIKKIDGLPENIDRLNNIFKKKAGEFRIINLDTSRAKISSFNTLKKTVCQRIWDTFLNITNVENLNLYMDKQISESQMIDVFNYYSGNISIKFSIKELYGTQSVRYYTSGKFKTNFDEFLTAMGIDLKRFLNKKMDTNIIKEDI